MIEIQLIRQNPDAVVAGLQKKHFPNAEAAVQKVLSTDAQRRAIQAQLDETLAQANQAAKQIGILLKAGKQAEAEAEKAKTAQLKEKEKQLQEQLNIHEAAFFQALVALPNLPHSSVPAGKTAEENQIVYRHGDIPQLPEQALPHWELIKKYDIIDFELGVKVTGAGFPFYKGKGAKLQRALIQFFLDEAEKAGYTEIQPPILINRDSGFGTGQLPDKDGQMYYIPADELYLIPTAEVPITNIYRDMILKPEDLPIKNVGYTPCFRREAGSWGADVRGLNRLHQFDKVEIVQIAHPDHSYQILEEMSQYVQSLLQQLELPYRVVKLCGGDMSFTSALTYDMEVYSAAQQRWLEVSSVSNFESYQANRLKLRCKDATNKKNFLLHTLNGSALALPRIVAALLENNQTPDGIKIPQVLQPYTRFDMIA